MNKIIGAVRNSTEFDVVLRSNVETVFLLGTNVEIIAEQVKLVHEKGKILYVHIDLADGIGNDWNGKRVRKI